MKKLEGVGPPVLLRLPSRGPQSIHLLPQFLFALSALCAHELVIRNEVRDERAKPAHLGECYAFFRFKAYDLIAGLMGRQHSIVVVKCVERFLVVALHGMTMV